MLFRVAIIAFIASAVSALKDLTPNGEILANSKLGLRILSQATTIVKAATARHRYDQEAERDITYIANYSIRYVGCHSLTQLVGGENNNDNNNNQQQEEKNMLYKVHLARFALCPTAGNCDNNCDGGGEYVMNMEAFIDAYNDVFLTKEEYACKTVRNNCDCEEKNNAHNDDDDDDDDQCEADCYTDAGLTNCVTDEFQQYLECNQMEGGNNDNGVVYYTGPYCSSTDGHSVHLGIFTDAYCNTRVDSTVFVAINGCQLPFTTTSMVESQCNTCMVPSDDALEASETCQDRYNMAIRCETKMDISSRDQTGCDFINNILPRLTVASTNKKSAQSSRIFAVIFGFTTCIFVAYAVYLYRKIKRGSVDHSSQVPNANII